MGTEKTPSKHRVFTSSRVAEMSYFRHIFLGTIGNDYANLKYDISATLLLVNTLCLLGVFSVPSQKTLQRGSASVTKIHILEIHLHVFFCLCSSLTFVIFV